MICPRCAVRGKSITMIMTKDNATGTYFRCPECTYIKILKKGSRGKYKRRDLIRESEVEKAYEQDSRKGEDVAGNGCSVHRHRGHSCAGMCSFVQWD